VINREFGSVEPGNTATSIFGEMDMAFDFSVPIAQMYCSEAACQAFSLAGRSRDPKRMKEDRRHSFLNTTKCD